MSKLKWIQRARKRLIDRYDFGKREALFYAATLYNTYIIENPNDYYEPEEAVDTDASYAT